MKNLNKNEKRRNLLLRFDHPKFLGGVERFNSVDLTTLKILLKEGFADPEDAQNSAPTFNEIVEFLEKHPKFTAHGYAVSSSRSDYRVTLEGISGPDDLTHSELEGFVTFAHRADEFQIHPPYAWWD